MNNSNSPTRIIFKDSEGIFFKVPSESEPDVVYDVHYYFNDKDYDWICNCPGNWYGHKCKHIQNCETILEGIV